MTTFVRIVAWTLILAAIPASVWIGLTVRDSLRAIAVEPGPEVLVALVIALVWFAAATLLAAVGIVIADAADRFMHWQIPIPTREAVPASRAARQAPLGMAVSPEPTGLFVDHVDQGSAAEAADLRPGDLISHVNGVTLAYLPSPTARVEALVRSTHATVTVWRSGTSTSVPLV